MHGTSNGWPTAHLAPKIHPSRSKPCSLTLNIVDNLGLTPAQKADQAESVCRWTGKRIDRTSQPTPTPTNATGWRAAVSWLPRQTCNLMTDNDCLQKAIRDQIIATPGAHPWLAKCSNLQKNQDRAVRTTATLLPHPHYCHTHNPHPQSTLDVGTTWMWEQLPRWRGRKNCPVSNQLT